MQLYLNSYDEEAVSNKLFFVKPTDKGSPDLIRTNFYYSVTDGVSVLTFTFHTNLHRAIDTFSIQNYLIHYGDMHLCLQRVNL